MTEVGLTGQQAAEILRRAVPEAKAVELWHFFYGREPDTPECIAEDLRGLIAAG
jgi:hypothetical protein